MLKRLVSFGLWALALTAPGPAAAQTADQFDAVCEIRNSYSNPELDEGDPDRRGEELMQLRFRIDTQSRTFCVDTCRGGIFDIGTSESVSDLNLTHFGFVIYRGEQRRMREPNVVVLNRQSGAISFAHRQGSFRSSGAGTCRREPFSGFPEAVF